MGSTALQICANAYRQANMDTELASFSTSQEYPYNIAIDLLNEVVADMNRAGDLWFMETETSLAWGALAGSYDCTALGIDPKRIKVIRRTDENVGDLKPLPWRKFQRLFRSSTIETNTPYYWSQYAGVIYINCYADLDYGLTVSHLKDFEPVDATSDTFTWPQVDEDVIRAGVYAYLLQRLGRGDFEQAYQIYKMKMDALKIDTKTDRSIPRVMPAAF